MHQNAEADLSAKQDFQFIVNFLFLIFFKSEFFISSPQSRWLLGLAHWNRLMAQLIALLPMSAIRRTKTSLPEAPARCCGFGQPFQEHMSRSVPTLPWVSLHPELWSGNVQDKYLKMRDSECPGSVALGQAHHPGCHQALGTLEEKGTDYFSGHFIRKKLNYADQ